MEYRVLTGTGAKVSRVCLGTMTFGAQVNEAESIRMVHRAMDAGVNFIDTADVYNQGLTETILAKALKDRRDRVVLASKVRNQIGPDRFRDQGLSRWHIMKGTEACLRRLDTDCLDILYLHRPDYDTPLEESLAATDLLVRQGKVMYVGLSNYAAWQMCRAQWICDRQGLAVPVVTQSVYHMLARGIEQEVLPFCRALKVGVTVYNPLAGGLLTGKHNPQASPAENTRFQLNKDYYGRYWRDSHFAAVQELLEIARQANKTPVALALQWLVAQDAVDAIIIGASNMSQLDENLSAWDGKLDAATLQAIDGVWNKIKGDSFAYNR